MSDNIALEAVARVVEQVVKNELDPVKQTLADHSIMLRSHSDSLEQLLSKKKIKEDETLITSDRLKRIEDFCQAAAKQLNIKFDP